MVVAVKPLNDTVGLVLVLLWAATKHCEFPVAREAIVDETA